MTGEYSSGERQQRGGISKAGPGRARSMLVEAGWLILRGRNPATEGYISGQRVSQ
jgi:transposase